LNAVALTSRPQMGGCPRLSELRLDGCDRLHAPRLRHSRLASLSLRGCRSLAHLRLSCAGLERFR
jgi:hypothetical protein